MNVKKFKNTKLMKAVRRYPCLYDSTAESYQNEALKKVAWDHICSKLFGYVNWLTMARKDKIKLEKYVQKRWEHLNVYSPDEILSVSTTRDDSLVNLLDLSPISSSDSDDSLESVSNDTLFRTIIPSSKIRNIKTKEMKNGLPAVSARGLKSSNAATVTTVSPSNMYFTSSDSVPTSISAYNSNRNVKASIITSTAGDTVPTTDITTSTTVVTDAFPSPAVTVPATTIIATVTANSDTNVATTSVAVIAGSISTSSSTIPVITAIPVTNAATTNGYISAKKEELNGLYSATREYDIFNPTIAGQSDDADKMFLLSLLPDFKKIPSLYKTNLQIAMLDKIQSYNTIPPVSQDQPLPQTRSSPKLGLGEIIKVEETGD